MHTIEKTDIVFALRELPLAAGDCVMLHSSLSSLGWVEGGTETVIEAFLETIGPAGTLAMPAFCQKDAERRFETWNHATAPSDVGRITEDFRLRRGVVRSDHATHSVAALGPLALQITQGHKTAGGRPGPWGEAAFGIGGPYDQLLEADAKIVLLGVDFTRNTIVHFIEHLVVERSLQPLPARERAAKTAGLRGWYTDGAWPLFDRLKLERELAERHEIGHSICGQATLLMCPARRTVNFALQSMTANPEEWFDARFIEWMAG